MYNRIALIILCAAVLAGCHGSGHLEAIPSSVSECGGANHPQTVSVSWDATKATNGGGVKLWVQNHGAFSNAKPTLWAQRGPKGTAETGFWVVAGTEISMTNANTGDSLAEITIGGIPCKE
ncbi:hypothetical protein [Rhodanobacter glycinis]|uniref:Uncharacterized protein n=1 Tax=Rhodanobacter glycinis TaxID=582702 RepID=A0A1I4D6J4_9GAMM|nr:hypothetical protein [Rhodanobacter glycinis]SFK88449.1 hypothetical protein SAMN05192579_10881 [Rhodanobacter glycinis]